MGRTCAPAPAESYPHLRPSSPRPSASALHLLQKRLHFCGPSLIPAPTDHTPPIHTFPLWIASAGSHLRSILRRCDYTRCSTLKPFLPRLNFNIWSVKYPKLTRGPRDLNQTYQLIQKHLTNLVKPSNHIKQCKKHKSPSNPNLMNLKLQIFHNWSRNLSNHIRLTSNFSHISYSTLRPTPTFGIGFWPQCQKIHYRSKSPKI